MAKKTQIQKFRDKARGKWYDATEADPLRLHDDLAV
jgi:hypothetical protein